MKCESRMQIAARREAKLLDCNKESLACRLLLLSS